jgi:hypothetical protein
LNRDRSNLAYIVRDEEEKNFLIRAINVAEVFGLLSSQESSDSKKRIFSFLDIQRIPAEHFKSNATLESFISSLE